MSIDKKNAVSTEDIPKDFGFPVEFIIWMGRHKLQVIETAEAKSGIVAQSTGCL